MNFFGCGSDHIAMAVENQPEKDFLRERQSLVRKAFDTGRMPNAA
jgi:hypothetical protein